MRQLLVVLAVLATLGVAARFAPAPQRILPLEFSEDFPEHREHHEQLLHNLGQKPLRSYPGDVVRMWWVGPSPLQLIVVEPDAVTHVHYSTAGYTPRITEVKTVRTPIDEFHFSCLKDGFFLDHELWMMTSDPGTGPFTVGGRTWILEMKLDEHYRIMEKIDPKPQLFSNICERILSL